MLSHYRTAHATPPVRFVPLPEEVRGILGLQGNVSKSVWIRGSEPATRQLLAQAMEAVDDNYDIVHVQYIVLTRHVDRWHTGKNCSGVCASYNESSWSMIRQLAAFAHSNKGQKDAILLFIDEFDLISDLDHDYRNCLHWLTIKGPARRVWPIIASEKNVPSYWQSGMIVVDKH